MTEVGDLVELSNNKKYIIVDSSLEDGSLYYLALEVDNETELPKDKDNGIFFKKGDNEGELIPVTDEADITFLKAIFLNNFLDDVMEQIDEEES